MRVLLMDPERAFEHEVVVGGADDLIADLQLETLFGAMSGGDRFLHEVARAALLAPPCDPAAIRWRQQVLDDCVAHPEAVDRLYGIALGGIARERREWGLASDSPTFVLGRSARVLTALLETLRELRSFARDQREALRSPGFQRLCEELDQQLSEDYLEEVKALLAALDLDRAALIGATLGRGLNGTGHRLLRARQRTLLERLVGRPRSGLSFEIAPRDEASQRALSRLVGSAALSAARAAAEAVAHILGFLRSLAAELAFYRGTLSLRRRLQELGVPLCTPTIQSGGRRWAASGLCDPCLAIVSGRRPVDNDLAADGRSLIVITGANRGGKSTFLRSVALAQLMAQSGMFVCAARFVADPRKRLFTHFRRAEDERLEHGKLDEELRRMAWIAERIGPGDLLLCNESFASTNEREAAEIAWQIVCALVQAGARVAFVTHTHELARRLERDEAQRAVFLRALPDAGFRLVPGAPEPTSYADAVYERVFGEPLGPPAPGR